MIKGNLTLMRVFPPIVTALVAVAACQAGTDANTVDVSGRWSFTETFVDYAHGMSCADTGTYDITQTGDRFVGIYAQRGYCTTPSGIVNNADSGAVAAGRVIGRTVRFMIAENCEYEGASNGVPPMELAGHGACVLHDTDRLLSFTGTWKATR
jgi:hypothetical protein